MKTKKEIFGIFILVSMIVTITFTLKCCKPERDKCEDTRYFEQEFLDYWYFPEGSWWVYKRIDTSADVYDTAVVTQVRNPEIIEDKVFVDYCYEYLCVAVTHSYEGLSLNSNDKVLVSFCSDYPSHKVQMNSYYSDYFSYANILHYPFDMYKVPSEFYSFKENISLYTSNDTFYDVIKITDKTVYKKDTTTNHVWLKKDVGFVKYHHFDDSVWELVDYEIF
jgi:hypothetical protein